MWEASDTTIIKKVYTYSRCLVIKALQQNKIPTCRKLQQLWTLQTRAFDISCDFPWQKKHEGNKIVTYSSQELVKIPFYMDNFFSLFLLRKCDNNEKGREAAVEKTRV